MNGPKLWKLLYTKAGILTITIQLSDQLADAVRRHDPSAQPLLELLKQHQLHLISFDAEASISSPLNRFYQVHTENSETGWRALSLIQQTAGVDAAYVKPAEEAP